jgi:hypothetical protein
LLQFAIEAIEPMGRGPIYSSIQANEAVMEQNMQATVIIKFLADSRRYLAR